MATVKNITSTNRKIIDNIKLSMPVAESGPEGYQALNTSRTDKTPVPTYAVGMYQFVPKWHLEEMRAFAKATDNLYINEADIPTLEDYEKARKTGDDNQVKALLQPLMDNNVFQDVYFDNYMVDVIGTSQKQYNKYAEKTGWSLEEFVAFNHIQGVGNSEKILSKSIKNPEILNQPIDDLNPISPNEYVKKHSEAIVKAGGKLTKPEFIDLETGTMQNPKADEKFKGLMGRYDKIQNNKDLTQQQKEGALDQLYKDVKSMGRGDEFNKILNDRNVADQNNYDAFKKGDTTGGLIHNLVQDPENTFTVNDDGSYQLKTKQMTNQERLDLLARLDKELPSTAYSKIDRGSSGRGSNWGANSKIVINGTKANSAYKLLEIPENEYKSLTGNTLYITADEKMGPQIVADPKAIKTPAVIPNKHYEPDFGSVKTADEIRAEAQIKSDVESGTEESTTTPVTESVGTGAMKDMTEEERLKYENDYFSNFLTQETIDVPDSFEYNKKDFKKEIPFEALGYGALGLIGAGQAETEDPLRNEQVSEAIINLAKTQKRISELGLRPEEEAIMKKNINDNFKFGMDNLVRSSGGNRNLVLSGQDALNRNRLEGIANVSLADVQTKLEGLKQYGDTLQYIENFNTNRDVANHGIKLENAREKRAAGIALANSGFTSMIDELAYQKNNGPGSANHMQKQAHLYELLGYVPGADIEPGKPGSYEYKKQQELGIYESNQKAKAENDLNMKVENRIKSMSPNEFQEFQRSGGFRDLRSEQGRERFLGIDNEQQVQYRQEEDPYQENNVASVRRPMGFAYLT